MRTMLPQPTSRSSQTFEVPRSSVPVIDESAAPSPSWRWLYSTTWIIATAQALANVTTARTARATIPAVPA